MKILSYIMLFCIAGSSSAGMDPIATAKDARVKIIPYDRNDVVQLLGHYGYTITVEYEYDEKVIPEMLNCGDTAAWETTPMGAYMVFKPRLENATTNCTVITNKRTYLYELQALDAKNPRSKNITYILRYTYPDSERRRAMHAQRIRDAEYIQAKEKDTRNRIDPTDLYFGYSFQGDTDIAPIQAYDDGVFTYFKFREKGAMPAVFTVDKQQNESLVNFRILNDAMVIEQLASQFTLRRGNQTVIIVRKDIPGHEGVTQDGVSEDKQLRHKNAGGKSYADW